MNPAELSNSTLQQLTHYENRVRANERRSNSNAGGELIEEIELMNGSREIAFNVASPPPQNQRPADLPAQKKPDSNYGFKNKINRVLGKIRKLSKATKDDILASSRRLKSSVKELVLRIRQSIHKLFDRCPRSFLNTKETSPKRATFFDKDINRAILKRKLARFLYCISSIILAIIIVSIWCRSTIKDGDVNLDPSKSLHLVVKKCTITLLELANDKIGSGMYAEYEFPRNKSHLATEDVLSQDSAGSQLLTIFNDGDPDHCYLNIYMRRNITLARDLDVRCYSCNLIQDFPFQLIVDGEIRVSGDEIHVNMQNVKTQRFRCGYDSKPEFGNIQLDNIETTAATLSSPSVILVKQGDVMVQSVQDFRIYTSGYSRAYCYSAPNITQFQNRSCNPSVADIMDDVVDVTCSRGHKLCSLSSCSTDSSSFLISVMTGNIFANQIPAVAQPSNLDNNITKSSIFLNGTKLSPYTLSMIGAFSSIASEGGKNSPTVILEMGDRGSRSSQYSKWIASSSSVYVALRPWWFGTLSAGILDGYTVRVAGSLYPGICPYKPVLSLQDLDLIQNLIDNNTAEQVRFVALVDGLSSSMLTAANAGSTMYSGVFSYLKDARKPQPWITFENTTEGIIQYHKNDLDQEPLALATVILSVITALLIAILGLWMTVNAILYIYNKINHFLSHLEGYSRLKKENRDRAAENEERKVSSEGFFDKLPFLSSFIDDLAELFYDQITSSLSRFNDALFKEDENGNYGSTEINFERYRDLYQQFCFVNYLAEDKLFGRKAKSKLAKYGYRITDYRSVQPKIVRMDVSSQQEDNYIDIDFNEAEDNSLLQTNVNKLFCRRRNYKYIIDIDEVKNRIKLKTSETFSGTDDRTKQSLCSLIWNRTTLLVDMLIVFTHMTYIALLSLPLVLFVILNQSEYTKWNIIDPILQLAWKEVRNNPARAYTNMFYNSLPWNSVIIGFAIGFAAFKIFGLLLYYATMTFEMNWNIHHTKSKAGGFTKALKALEWLSFSFILLGIYVYTALFLLWLLLGAFISPNALLPFTSAAATLMTFIVAKYTLLKGAYYDKKGMVLNYISRSFTEAINNAVRKLVDQNKNSVEVFLDGAKGILIKDPIRNIKEQLAETRIVNMKLIGDFEDKILKLNSEDIMSEGAEFINDPEAVTQKLKILREELIQAAKQDILKKASIVLNEDPKTDEEKFGNLIHHFVMCNEKGTKDALCNIVKKTLNEKYKQGLELLIEVLHLKEANVTAVTNRFLNIIFISNKDLKSKIQYLMTDVFPVILDKDRDLGNMSLEQLIEIAIKLIQDLKLAKDDKSKEMMKQMIGMASILTKKRPNYSNLLGPIVSFMDAQLPHKYKDVFRFMLLLLPDHELFGKLNIALPTDQEGILELIKRFFDVINLGADYCDQNNLPANLFANVTFLALFCVKNRIKTVPESLVADMKESDILLNIHGIGLKYLKLLKIFSNNPQQIWNRITYFYSISVSEVDLQDFLKAIVSYDILDLCAENFALNLVENRYFKRIAKITGIHTQKLIGLLDLATKRTNSPFIDTLLMSLLRRTNNMMKDRVKVFKALLSFFMAKDESELSKAAEVLGIKDWERINALNKLANEIEHTEDEMEVNVRSLPLLKMWNVDLLTKENIQAALNIISNSDYGDDKTMKIRVHWFFHEEIDILIMLLCLRNFKADTKGGQNDLRREQLDFVHRIALILNKESGLYERPELLVKFFKLFLMKGNISSTLKYLLIFAPELEPNERLFQSLLTYGQKQHNFICERVRIKFKDLLKQESSSDLDSLELYVSILTNFYDKKKDPVTINDFLQITSMLLGQPLKSLDPKTQDKIYRLGVFARNPLAVVDFKRFSTGVEDVTRKLFSIMIEQNKLKRLSLISSLVHDKHPLKISLALYGLITQQKFFIQCSKGKDQPTNVMIETYLKRFIKPNELEVYKLLNSFISLSLAQHFDSSDLAKKLNIIEDHITFFITISRLADKKTRASELEKLADSKCMKKVFSYLTIDITEFVAFVKMSCSMVSNRRDFNNILSVLKEEDIVSRKNAEAINSVEFMASSHLLGLRALNIRNTKVGDDTFERHFTFIKRETSQLINSLGLNQEGGLPLIFSRLATGDFMILKERAKEFEWAFLGSSDKSPIRNMTMAVCGLINPNIPIARPTYVEESEISKTMDRLLKLTQESLGIDRPWTQAFLFDKRLFDKLDELNRTSDIVFTKEFLLCIVLNITSMTTNLKEWIAFKEWRKYCEKFIKEPSVQDEQINYILDVFSDRIKLDYESILQLTKLSPHEKSCQEVLNTLSRYGCENWNESVNKTLQYLLKECGVRNAFDGQNLRVAPLEFLNDIQVHKRLLVPIFANSYMALLKLLGHDIHHIEGFEMTDFCILGNIACLRYDAALRNSQSEVTLILCQLATILERKLCFNEDFARFSKISFIGLAGLSLGLETYSSVHKSLTRTLFTESYIYGLERPEAEYDEKQNTKETRCRGFLQSIKKVDLSALTSLEEGGNQKFGIIKLDVEFEAPRNNISAEQFKNAISSPNFSFILEVSFGNLGVLRSTNNEILNSRAEPKKARAYQILLTFDKLRRCPERSRFNLIKFITTITPKMKSDLSRLAELTNFVVTGNNDLKNICETLGVDDRTAKVLLKRIYKLIKKRRGTHKEDCELSVDDLKNLITFCCEFFDGKKRSDIHSLSETILAMMNFEKLTSSEHQMKLIDEEALLKIILKHTKQHFRGQSHIVDALILLAPTIHNFINLDSAKLFEDLIISQELYENPLNSNKSDILLRVLMNVLVDNKGGQDRIYKHAESLIRVHLTVFNGDLYQFKQTSIQTVVNDVKDVLLAEADLSEDLKMKISNLYIGFFSCDPRLIVEAIGLANKHKKIGELAADMLKIAFSSVRDLGSTEEAIKRVFDESLSDKLITLTEHIDNEDNKHLMTEIVEYIIRVGNLYYRDEQGKDAEKLLTQLMQSLGGYLTSEVKSVVEVFNKIYAILRSPKATDIAEVKEALLQLLNSQTHLIEDVETKNKIELIIDLMLGRELDKFWKCDREGSGLRDRTKVFVVDVLPKILKLNNVDLEPQVLDDIYTETMRIRYILQCTLENSEHANKAKKELVRDLRSRGWIDENLSEVMLSFITDGLSGLNRLSKRYLSEETAKMMNDPLKYIKRALSLQHEYINKFDYLENSLANKRKQISAKALTALLNRKSDQIFSSRDLFEVVSEGEGHERYLTEEGFQQLARNIGYELGDHRVNEIFATFQRVKEFGDVRGRLNQKEFDRAIEYLKRRQSQETLAVIGITPEKFFLLLIFLVTILILMFVFIFLGISTFTVGGVFGTVINSLFPVAAGLGLGLNRDRSKIALKEKTIEAATNDSAKNT